MNQVIVIAGPTASGKTGLSVEVAKQLHTEIVSADSMQIYQGMDVGTAKVTADEMCGIPHHMIDIVSPMENYNVSRYVEDAKIVVDDILSRRKIPVIAGGLIIDKEDVMGALAAGAVSVSTTNQDVWKM